MLSCFAIAKLSAGAPQQKINSCNYSFLGVTQEGMRPPNWKGGKRTSPTKTLHSYSNVPLMNVSNKVTPVYIFFPCADFSQYAMLPSASTPAPHTVNGTGPA